MHGFISNGRTTPEEEGKIEKETKRGFGKGTCRANSRTELDIIGKIRPSKTQAGRGKFLEKVSPQAPDCVGRQNRCTPEVGRRGGAYRIIGEGSSG